MQTKLSIPIRVRYVECDPMRVAHHSAYLPWLEMARTDLLRTNGMSYKDCEDQGIYFVVARLSIRYRAPAFYDDDLTVEVELAEGRRVKLDHAYRVTRGDKFIADGETTLVCVDKDGIPRPVPDLFLEQG